MAPLYLSAGHRSRFITIQIAGHLSPNSAKIFSHLPVKTRHLNFPYSTFINTFRHFFWYPVRINLSEHQAMRLEIFKPLRSGTRFVCGTCGAGFRHVEDLTKFATILLDPPTLVLRRILWILKTVQANSNYDLALQILL